MTRVELLIAAGEGESIEFKQQLPESDVQGVMKTVAAFANGGGGALLFGIDNDGLVVGAGSDRESIDRLTSLISDRVRPHVHFTINMTNVDGLDVLVVDVPAGADTPYGVGTNDRDVVYYVRRGATSFPASPADVRSFVRARLSVANEQHYPFPLP